MLCKALTKSGKPCRKRAVKDGLCAIHHPSLITKRRLPAKQRSRTPGARLRMLILAIRRKWFRTPILSYPKLRIWRKANSSSTQHNKTGTQQALERRKRKELTHMMYLDDEILEHLIEPSHGNDRLRELQKAIRQELRHIRQKGVIQSPKDIVKLKVYKLISRFHRVAVQLKRRRRKQQNLHIRGEKDIQSLFHGILKIFFDDIRIEEFSPSYGGANSRLDFLLKKEKTVIELKMASSALHDKRLGEELIVDIERYKTHPDCEQMICFIYDPENHIQNPFGLEEDLSKLQPKNMEVQVYVFPK